MMLFDLGQRHLQGLGLFAVSAVGVVGVLDRCVHGKLLENQLVSALRHLAKPLRFITGWMLEQ
jgi:hypothetical protein